MRALGVLLDEQLRARRFEFHPKFIVAERPLGGILGQHAHQGVSLVGCVISGNTRFGGVSGVCTCAATNSSTVGASNGTWPVIA